MPKTVIIPPGTGKPLAPYVAGTLADGVLNVSGTLPLDADANVVHVGDAGAQTRHVLETIKGVVTAAGDLAVEHAFTPRAMGGLGLSRLSALTAADNVASNSVLERLGFVRFGVEHATDLLPDGTWENAYHWELLRSER